MVEACDQHQETNLPLLQQAQVAQLVAGLKTEMISIGKLHDDSKRWITFGKEVWIHDTNPALVPGAERIGTRACTKWTYYTW